MLRSAPRAAAHGSAPLCLNPEVNGVAAARGLRLTDRSSWPRSIAKPPRSDGSLPRSPPANAAPGASLAALPGPRCREMSPRRFESSRDGFRDHPGGRRLPTPARSPIPPSGSRPCDGLHSRNPPATVQERCAADGGGRVPKKFCDRRPCQGIGRGRWDPMDPQRANSRIPRGSSRYAVGPLATSLGGGGGRSRGANPAQVPGRLSRLTGNLDCWAVARPIGNPLTLRGGTI